TIPPSAILLAIRISWRSSSNSMPEGDLADVSSWEKNDTVALEVTMEHPQKLYLRGMVGEIYTGTSWEPLSGDTQAEYKDLFYWLHQEGFYGQSEISSAGLLTQTQPETSSVQITNLTACKERMFLPYAVCTNELFDAMRIGDATYAEENAYSLEMLTGNVPDWYVYQSALADRQAAGDPEALTFLDNEQAYRQYVYENDLTITDEACEALVTALGTETDELSLEEIKSRIRDYLDTNMDYDENVSQSGETDFLSYTLRKGRGYSVHYATLAVLMLRYYGVPARYVEGYFLSAAEAENFTSGDTIPLDENHAHAWAEYYLDGVGWMPFEVTPGYLDDEEIELETVFDENSPYYQDGAKSYSRSYVSKHRPSPEIVEPEDTQESASGIGAMLFKLSNLFWILLTLLICLLLWVIRGRIRLHRALRRIAELPEEEAVAAWFGYAVALMRLAGFRGMPETEHFASVMAKWAGEPTGLYEKAYMDNLAAKFGKTAADGRREFMEEFAKATVGLCLNRWTCRQRLYYRWINCWYL
ncbi:MAG TPA: transglutaminase domain-containing protein, partial [Oscillospiraceae bacterium]|nr:transglutaminase domain-containing protein [Oscillospiraceae bacterium]